MSYPNDAPAAAWYPDPQTSGQVRWWDGTNWTEHVSRPSVEAGAEAETTAAAAATPASVALSMAEQPAAPAVWPAGAPDDNATVTYVGRHAAGATPAPRVPSTAPRIRPRVRVEVPADAHSEVRVEALAFA
jgi:hypothetical protein